MRLRYNPRKGFWWLDTSGEWFGPYPTARWAVLDALQIGAA